jgi:hypothetical protein
MDEKREQFVFSSCSVCVQFVFSLCSVRVQFAFSLCSVRVLFVFCLCSVSVQFYDHDQTIEGWLMLTVETEVDIGQMKGALSWLVCWACRAGTTNFCSALAALSAQYKLFFSWAGSRAGSPVS